MAKLMDAFVMKGIESTLPSVMRVRIACKATHPSVSRCSVDGNSPTSRTGLCPGGNERMKRLLRLIETGRVDPTPLTTHRFKFEELERAFHMMETKEDGIIKPLIVFD